MGRFWKNENSRERKIKEQNIGDQRVMAKQDLKGSRDHESQSRPQNVSLHPSVEESISSSRLPPACTDASSSCLQRSESASHVSPAEANGLFSTLKDMSVDELKKLLSDKEAYNQFVLSLDQVTTPNNVIDELQKETLKIARENLELEPHIMELRNQCEIIRTTEIAAAQKKLKDLERQKEEILTCYAPAPLLRRLQDTMKKTDEESEALQCQFLDRVIELGLFVRKYKQLRSLYHERALTNLAVVTLEKR